MLKSLTIENYALIERLELQPSAQLNIITGETGAGKSIMVGAIGLLLGNRADTRVLSDPDRKCFIEGEFEISKYKLKEFFDEKDLDYDDTVLIRREIGISGKSRAFVNDTPVTLDTLKELGNYLMDIHSQNDTQLLGSASFQLGIIDDYAESDILAEVFKSKFLEYNNALNDYERIKEEERAIRRESDFNNFLLEELHKAQFEEGEQERLESDQEVMANAEEIKLRLNQALEILSVSEFSIVSGLESMLQNFRQLTSISETYKSLYERIESVLIELQDIKREVESAEDKVEHDPQKIVEIQDRLGVLYHLQQKHQTNSVVELLNIQAGLEEKVNRFHHLDEELANAEKTLANIKQDALLEAKRLSKLRKASFAKFCDELTLMLRELGMDKAVIKIHYKEAEMSSTGIDQISILFSASKGVAPLSLKLVASGGEFSRVMFCIKYLLAGKTALPTIIFDEIDAGVAGEIARKLGTMMKEMAINHQVIAISHLPQIAAKANRHYYVYKDSDEAKAVSKIRLLSDDERIVEIAKMIAGDKPSQSAITSARELMLN